MLTVDWFLCQDDVPLMEKIGHHWGSQRTEALERRIRVSEKKNRRVSLHDDEGMSISANFAK